MAKKKLVKSQSPKKKLIPKTAGASSIPWRAKIPAGQQTQIGYLLSPGILMLRNRGEAEVILTSSYSRDEVRLAGGHAAMIAIEGNVSIYNASAEIVLVEFDYRSGSFQR